MKSTPPLLHIGAAAERFGLATHVLRHWESLGLLKPARVSGQRRYGDKELHRIATIMRAKQAGLSLDRIEEMLNTRDGQARREVLLRQREELQATIDAAEGAVQMLSCALECSHDDFTQCPHYRAAMAPPASSRRRHWEVWRTRSLRRCGRVKTPHTSRERVRFIQNS